MLFVIGLFALVAALPAKIIAPSPQNRSQPKKDPPQITLKIKNSEPILAVKEDYHNPSSIWVIINKDKPILEKDYRPKDLIIPPVPVNQLISSDERYLRSTITSNVENLLNDAKTNGYDLFIASGYRSYELQKQYFDSYAKQNGEEAANSFSARPGTSEHQTGIAFDVSLSSRECYLETCFGMTKAGLWLANNAYIHGFIIRYPENKVDLTKYQYKPWHLRYVGTALAKVLKDNDLALDEIADDLDSVRERIVNTYP